MVWWGSWVAWGSPKIWGYPAYPHESEDSTKLNTAFIERLNLTIRQGSAYLHRRSVRKR